MTKPDGLIEFRYPDGRVGHEESELDMHWPPRRGDHFEFDGVPKSYRLDLVSNTASRNGIVELEYRRHR